MNGLMVNCCQAFLDSAEPGLPFESKFCCWKWPTRPKKKIVTQSQGKPRKIPELSNQSPSGRNVQFEMLGF